MKAKYRYILGRKKSYPESLELEVYINRNSRTYISAKYSIPAKFWDDTRQCVSSRFPNAIAINEYLSNLRTRIEAAELKAINANSQFTIEDAKAAAYSDGHKSSADMLLLFNEYNDSEYKRNAIKVKTWEKHRSEINKFEEYIVEKYGSRYFMISDFDKNALCDFDTWIQDRYQPSTIVKLHATLKMYFLKAIEQNKTDINPYKNFRLKKVHTKRREALTEEQLHALESIDRASLRSVDPRLELVLDKLLLSCYCGLRIGDNATLLKTEIRKEQEGYVIDKITDKMDGTQVLLPMRDLFAGKGEEIIERYLNKYPDIPTLFPEIPDQKVNEKLKVIALVAKIPFNLTFHTARHTCATLLAEKTGNPFVVMKILGHKDIKTSMIYIHNSYNATRQALSNVTW